MTSASKSENRIALPVRLRACLSTYFILGAICGFPTLVPAVVVAMQGEWIGSAFLGLCFALLFAWIASFRIVLTDDHITFVKLFGGSSSLPYGEIASARIELGWAKTADRLKGAYRLVLVPNKRAAQKMEINIKVFSREDLTLLMQVLAIKAPGARMDDRCSRMCKGKLPSLFFESQ